MMYFGVIGNRDHIKLKGEKRPYWEFLDRQPDGWLSSLIYKRHDLPTGKPTVIDCGAWSYKAATVPPIDAESVIDGYLSVAPKGAILIAPDHMLIDGVDHAFRRKWNAEQALKFLKTCPPDYVPMACIHGQTLDERVDYAEYLLSIGYECIAVGGIAARASQPKVVLEIVKTLRYVTRGYYLHVLGLSSPNYCREWRRLFVDSCDGASHFKQAFTGGAFFTADGDKLTKHQAVQLGESADHLPLCDCTACSILRDEGIDTRSYGSNENNMGRAAHNQNMLMRAQRVATRTKIGLVACCGDKLPGRHRASDLYQSALFQKSKAYAERHCDKWFILSAKHGVISPQSRIDHYDQTLSTMPVMARNQWADMVAKQLRSYRDDTLVVLAGNRYCEWIDRCDWAKDADIRRPMEGMGIGQQLAFLTRALASESDQGVLF